MKGLSRGVVVRSIVFSGLPVLILLSLLGSTLARDVIPTNEWVSFGSTNSTSLGQPLPAGAAVAAFHPQRTQRGPFPLHNAGLHGPRPCSRVPTGGGAS